MEKLEKKKKRELTPEDKARLEELRKKKKVKEDTFSPDSTLLEISSKSGLYPLYLAYNIYRSRLRNAIFSPETLEEHQAILDSAVAESIFVICKTPMAKAITRRTLLGFRKGKVNMWAPDDLINKIKNQPELFIKKVHDLVGKNVKIKAIVGNPPYQVMDGGGAGTSAISKWHTNPSCVLRSSAPLRNRYAEWISVNERAVSASLVFAL